jgi:hypothetical protein
MRLPRRTTILAAAVVALGCRPSVPLRRFENEARAIGDWVIPTGASTEGWRDMHPGMTITRTSDLSVPLTWAGYQARLRGKVPPGYLERERSGTREVFSRVDDGLLFTVTLDLLTIGPPLRVRVNLIAMPLVDRGEWQSGL